jgi:hypothetical protein
MNDKWTQGELTSAIGWAEAYSRTAPKTWSFGLCAFSLFALVFVGSNSIAISIALIMSIITGANLFLKNELIKKETQSVITIIGYITSVSLIFYSNVYHHI